MKPINFFDKIKLILDIPGTKKTELILPLSTSVLSCSFADLAAHASFLVCLSLVHAKCQVWFKSDMA